MPNTLANWGESVSRRQLWWGYLGLPIAAAAASGDDNGRRPLGDLEGISFILS